MELILEPIPVNEDKTKAIFASEDCQTLLQMWEDYYPKIGYHLPWVGYLVKQEDTIVGSCAFTGPPVNNRAEVSYWTFKEHEGKGIASWACQRLVSIAKESDRAVIVTAKTAPEHNASTKVLERNGFTFLRVVQDHEIGDAWEWILKS